MSTKIIYLQYRFYSTSLSYAMVQDFGKISRMIILRHCFEDVFFAMLETFKY